MRNFLYCLLLSAPAAFVTLPAAAAPGASAPASTSSSAPAQVPAAKIFLAPFAAGYEKPLQITAAPNGDLYVVEQPGRVRLLDPDDSRRPAVLDLRDDVVPGAEAGLLGFAFHPQFDQNRLTYAHYLGKSREVENRISEFQIPESGAAGTNEERKLIRISQKEVVNTGGQILFGPDGFLYIGLGDGSGSHDEQNRGQNPNDQLADILRISVEAEKSTNQEYLAPVNNPFVVNNLGNRDVFALGLRNPRSFSFDSETKNFFVGDAGAGTEQEVDLVRAGGNYGWSVFDGSGCLRMRFECMNQKYLPPLASYLKQDGTSITMGFVYRGSNLPPELKGVLFYGDRTTGKIWGLKYDGAKVVSNTLLLETGKEISTFGQSANGELFVADYITGDIFKISATH